MMEVALRNGEPLKIKHARQHRDANAQLPLPGGTGWKAAAADPGNIGTSGLAQGHADASFQRDQYARRGYDQALSTVRRRDDVRILDSINLRSQNRERLNYLGQ